LYKAPCCSLYSSKLGFSSVEFCADTINKWVDQASEKIGKRRKLELNMWSKISMHERKNFYYLNFFLIELSSSPSLQSVLIPEHVRNATTTSSNNTTTSTSNSNLQTSSNNVSTAQSNSSSQQQTTNAVVTTPAS